jgi:hypothetical protein
MLIMEEENTFIKNTVCRTGITVKFCLKFIKVISWQGLSE